MKFIAQFINSNDDELEKSYNFLLAFHPISALPTYSPTRQCMKYENKRTDARQQQIGNLNDNSITSDESQDDSESDDDMENYIDTNSTSFVSKTIKIYCKFSV